MLKTFAGRGYLHSQEEVVLLWHPLVNFYIWLTISSCYGSIPWVFGLIVRDGGLITLCHSGEFARQQRVLKIIPVPGYLHSEDWIVCLWHPLVTLYVWLTISSCYGSISLGLGLIVRDGGLSTLCDSCGFPCQQRVLKTFRGPGYFHTEDGVVRLWHPQLKLYEWLTILSCYDWMPLGLGFIWRDGSLSTLCHSCGFASHQRVLKTFPGPGYLHYEIGVVWLYQPLVNL